MFFLCVLLFFFCVPVVPIFPSFSLLPVLHKKRHKAPVSIFLLFSLFLSFFTNTQTLLLLLFLKEKSKEGEGFTGS